MTKCGWQMFAGSSLILHFVQRCKLQGDLFKQLTGNVFIMVVKEDDDFYAGIPEGDSALLCSLHSWAACWKLGERGQQNSGCRYLAGPGSQEGRGFKGRKVTGSHQGHHPSELEDPPHSLPTRLSASASVPPKTGPSPPRDACFVKTWGTGCRSYLTRSLVAWHSVGPQECPCCPLLSTTNLY